ncbi:hypothetical protein ACIOC1_07370 [Streptomyces sp. NPDC088197]|uniref:hypothetical protein n=1 Tax=unclassified Streptomyces TaxID=2593676 RepID=UPI0033A32CE6
MISIMTTVKMTDRSVVATCPLGVSPRATRLSSALLPVLPIRERNERPMQAPAAAVAAKVLAHASAFAAAANGAGAGTAKAAIEAKGAIDGFASGGFANGNGQQKTQQYGKWAFRGLEPWSDPA